ncbi:hypothetical protein [Magnetospirillum sp. UT-4]|uniref:hypothetical protein n=1 Tax=Magnetospirillum sp. UT-4 TaxID=2681467 RepID=UPI001383170F|nr:hypothetical protein [Magnetospirillum sp. UT-4]CAA7612930.1 hypothetical protein MTBUT4_120103 [Magnetospirillum sp. UT-4]
MTALWGWQHLNDDSRAMAVPAAEASLAVGHPDGGSMLPGYRALEHLEEFDPSRLDRLPREAWERWAPAIVTHSLNNDETLGPRLGKRCHAPAAAAFRDAFKRCGTNSPSYCLKGVWDVELGRTLVETLNQPDLQEETVAEIIRLLVHQDHPDGLAYVRSAMNGQNERRHRSRTGAPGVCRPGGRPFGRRPPGPGGGDRRGVAIGCHRHPPFSHSVR